MSYSVIPKNISVDNKTINENKSGEIQIKEVITGYKLTSATYLNSLDVSSQSTSPYSMTWNNDGTKLYILGYTNKKIYEYNVSIPYDVTSSTYLSFLDISSHFSATVGMTWNNDGSKLYIINSGNHLLCEYNVLTLYDVTSATYSDSLDVSSQVSESVSISWNNNGSKLYILGKSSKKIYEYNVSNPYDVTSATYSDSLDISNKSSYPYSITWNNDGSKLYLLDYASQKIYKYNVLTPYDVTSATYSDSLDVSSQDTGPTGITWNNDGTKLYVIGRSNKKIYSYNNTATAYILSNTGLKYNAS